MNKRGIGLVIKEPDKLVLHLKHEIGYYGVFVKELDNFVYIGFSKDIRNVCQSIIAQVRGEDNRTLINYLRQFDFEFSKIVYSGEINEQTHLNLIYKYKTYPLQFGGYGLNLVNPVTGKRFKKESSLNV